MCILLFFLFFIQKVYYIIILFIQFSANTFTEFIPSSINYKINELNQNNQILENKLNQEIIKNKNLKEENNKLLQENIKLKEELNENNKLKIELDNYTKDNNKLKLDLDNYIKENNKLKDDLLKANKIIANIGNNNTINNEIMNLKYQLLQKDNENGALKYQLPQKDNEIKDLKLKSRSDDEKNNQILNMDEIMIVYFQSLDQEINHVGIKCLSSDTFAEVEEKLCKKFDNYRNTNKIPICNGRTVLRFKTLSENNIKDENVVQLIKME